MPYRKIQPGDRTAVAPADLTRQRCEGWVGEPAHKDAAGRNRPASRRRCPGLLDPVLAQWGFRSHPCCDPDEVSPLCPPLPWPAWILGGEPGDDRLVVWDGGRLVLA
jgi:hypothetical protein